VLKKLGLLAASALMSMSSTSAFAVEKLTALHAFPANWVYSKSFLAFVKKVNEQGKGVVEITVRGGPEAMGMFEQPNAVRNGVVDMVYTPCAFYAAAVPECDAVSASSIDGPTARKSGAYAALNEAHGKRMGVHYLGWFDSGIRFHLWSTKQPKIDAQGNLDVKGFKVRGNPIYNAFLTNYLGAQVLNMPSTDIYTALERGTIAHGFLFSGPRGTGKTTTARILARCLNCQAFPGPTPTHLALPLSWWTPCPSPLATVQSTQQSPAWSTSSAIASRRCASDCSPSSTR
jgi:TRAP-type C4-dicarboxylate transport system substrate-binding protein